ncbi:unnamed protein product [Closterium sp. NIES-53]
MAEHINNDVARAQQAQSQAPGTPGQPAPQTSQHGSVGKPASAANDGVVRNDEDDDHSSTHPEETNAAKSQPRVTISVPAGESTLPSPVALKPQRPPCFDSSQRGGPTVQAWLFTLNVFFDANYVSEDTAKIRYAVSLLRGPAMDWWRVIVTKPVDYATLSTREGQTGPWVPSYFMEVPQYRTWDMWCADEGASHSLINTAMARKQRLPLDRCLREIDARVVDGMPLAIGWTEFGFDAGDFGNSLQPIAYESHELHPPERNYPIHDRGMLVIVHAFKVWRCYLTGADVTVRTDHRSLLRAQLNLNPQQIRWLDYLKSNFHYTVTYKKGASNIADALTRPTAQLHAILLAQPTHC